MNWNKNNNDNNPWGSGGNNNPWGSGGGNNPWGSGGGTEFESTAGEDAGGGGGGVLHKAGATIVAGTYALVVGAGGTCPYNNNGRGTNGGDTTGFGATAKGGGAGGAYNSGEYTGSAGGSGGGAPNTLSRSHFPRSTGEVRFGCEVTIKSPPCPSKPRRG